MLTDNAEFLMVDVPRKEAVHTRRALLKAGIAAVVQWEGPLPSPGSSPKEERVAFRGHLPPGLDPLRVRLLTREARHCGLPPEAVVGSSSLYANGAAFVMELTDPRTIERLGGHMEEALFLSARQVLMLPEGTAEEWTQKATELAIADPAFCVTEIRWRKSRNSGRPWIRPQVLAQDLRAKIANAQGPAAPDAEATVLLAFSGPSLGGNPQGLLAAAVAKADEALLSKLEQAAPNRALQDHQWAPVLDAMNAWTGHLRIRCKSPAEAATLHTRLNNTPVWTGSSWCMLSVSNNTLLASAPPSHPGNGNRRSSGRTAGC